MLPIAYICGMSVNFEKKIYIYLPTYNKTFVSRKTSNIFGRKQSGTNPRITVCGREYNVQVLFKGAQKIKTKKNY